MRLAYIADGTSLHVQRWLNYFASTGYEVHLISGRVMAGYHENVRVHLLTRFCPRIWWLFQYPSFLLWIFQARQLVGRIKPDVVDSQYITVYGFLAACSGFHPLVVAAMGSDILIDSRRNILLKSMVKYPLKRADVVICNSDTVKDRLISLETNPEKIYKIYNGIDTHQFSLQRRDAGFKHKWFAGGGPVVISIRSLRPLYNVEMLVRAIPLILVEVPEAKFIIGGQGEQKIYLENMAQSLGISNSVSFVGWIPHDDLSRFLASSDVYVSTSRSDSASLSLQEAMACELAPVVTDLPGNREWIDDSENGFVVPQNDVTALANKVAYLLKNSEARTRFGRLGREIIQERAEYQKEMAKMDKIYRQLVRSKE
jgi:glycosyltransferase involved in cell wall biosynthesis